MDATEPPLLINQFTEISAVDLWKQSGASVDYSAYGGTANLGTCMISLKD